MSIMFLNDLEERPRSIQTAAATSVSLYVLTALVLALAIPLAVSFILGGMAPMLILSAFLMPIFPVVALLACAVVAFQIVIKLGRSSISRYA